MDYFIMSLADAFIPVAVVVVMPVLIVWIITRWKTNRDNKKAEILIKAVETNSIQDVDKILGGMPARTHSMKDVMLTRLLRGCIFFFIGITLLLNGWIFWSSAGYASDTLWFCLIIGSVAISIGLAYLVVYWVSRKMLASEDKNDNE